MSEYDIAVFDFDGTIADTREGVFDSIVYALEAYNLPIPEKDALNAFLGPPLHNGFVDVIGVDDDLAEKLVAKYRELYIDNAMYRLKLFDGVEDLLKSLRNNGVKLAIASSKPEVFFERILKKVGIYDLFDTVCGDILHSKTEGKEDIILRAISNLTETGNEKIIMVGDRHYDVLGAKKVGIPCIGVVFGFDYEEELCNAGADHIAKTADEVKNIIL